MSTDLFPERTMLKPSEAVGVYATARSLPVLPATHDPRPVMEPSNPHLERWARVKQRLRTEVGDDVFSSWFARMDLDEIVQDQVRLSVPTRFLKSWIQAHYAERLLTCWKAEQPELR